MAKRPWDGASEVERALLLARRKYPGHLPTLYERLAPNHPRPLDPLEWPRAYEMLWAAIGRKLAEKEPEFSPGKRRKPGAKNKKVVDIPEERARRKYRDGKRDREKRSVPGLPDLMLEDGVSLKPVWKR
jgi:hypothetical protein